MFKRNNKGFTLIEVVLVLAIGGLIFLLAFVAFRQVSINRRDTQRRTDAARIVAELHSVYVDTRAYPESSVGVNQASICTASGSANSFKNFMGRYACINGVFKAPGTEDNYHAAAASSGFTANATNRIIYELGSKCKEDGSGTEAVAGSATFALRIKLEKGIVCRDSVSL